MTHTPVPFVNLTVQHEPLQTQIEAAIATVLQRGDFILGKAVQEFEVAFAELCKVPHAIGVASGTAAINLALRACGIGPGDEVIVPANTFIATVIGVHEAGATPVLVDCDPETALIDLEAASQAVTTKTRAIVPVHLYGQMVSPQQLLDFATAYKVLIIEDAAQAHGAVREGSPAGSVGCAAGFSFYPSKNLGAMGNGGMVVTQDAAIADNVRSLRNYGAPKKYFHTELGTNSRLDTLQAAILQVKLPQLTRWNQERNQAAHYYDSLLNDLRDRGIQPLRNDSGEGHVYHLYVVKCDPQRYERQQLQDRLAAHQIQTGVHYPIPCHLQPAFEYLGYGEGSFPHAELLSGTILSLPMFPGITDQQIRQVVEALAQITATPQLPSVAGIG
ncbi:MAG: DegT/DnrJ/EryC1/StrS family aminotransferase [Cyanobacteria bacterium P01_H01_bin.121]